MTKKRKLRVFALGGNEIAPVASVDAQGKTSNPDIGEQWRRTAATCDEIAKVIAADPDSYYVITHGNGPQIGNILLRAELSTPVLHPLPLDVCGADSQGALGYMLEQINNSFAAAGMDKMASGLISCCVVDPDDDAFKNPTKFIGQSFSDEQAREKEEKNHWVMKVYKKTPEGKNLWRRVVASPEPKGIRELKAVIALLKGGIIPIACGGGGIPVAVAKGEIHGNTTTFHCSYGVDYVKRSTAKDALFYYGIEAVIDKDLSSAAMALEIKKTLKEEHGEEVEAELYIITDVDGVRINYQQPNEQIVHKISLSEAARWSAEGQFGAGSMGPKVKACMNFISGGGDRSFITSVKALGETMTGAKGTTFTQ